MLVIQILESMSIDANLEVQEQYTITVSGLANVDMIFYPPTYERAKEFANFLLLAEQEAQTTITRYLGNLKW